MSIYEQTYLPDILHGISQGMLVPTMALIILMILACIFFLGWVVMEFFTERKHFKQNRAAIVNDINDATYENVVEVVEGSQLLNFQKAALITVGRNMGLPAEPLFSLAQMEIGAAEKLYKRRLAWTDTLAKIAPLMGLMGTLIPLGPGIVALGQNEVELLSQSLLLAFDATVCGLICAIFSLVVSKVRSGWYTEYVDVLEAVMSCVVDKAEQARKAGVQLPANYTGDAYAELMEKGKAAVAVAESEPATESEPAVEAELEADADAEPEAEAEAEAEADDNGSAVR